MDRRVTRYAWRALSVLALCACTESPVLGWGNEGHRAVALVAQAQLKAPILKKLKTLVGPLTLADLATCADELRTHERTPSFDLSPPCLTVFPSPQPTGTADWHFINLDVTKSFTDPAIDTLCKNDCVVAKIIAFQAALHDHTAKASARAQALAFLVHFVGDVHQPLHAAERNNDRGGNLLIVSVAEPDGRQLPENLHAIWDTFFVTLVAGNERAFVAKIGPQVTAAKREVAPAVLGPWVHSWARESESLAKTTAYRDHNKDIDPQSTPTLSPAYEQAAMATIEQQIAKAGFRLATLITRALE